MQSYPNAVRRFGLAALEARGPTAMPPRRVYSARPQRPAHRTVVRLWLPVTAIFWILSPAPLLLAPLGWFAPPRYRPANPYVAIFAIGRLLTSLGGTLVDVDTPDALVRIRLF